MKRKIAIPNTTAKKMFKLIKVLAISPKTSNQIKTSLDLKKVPHNTINGLKALGFIEKVNGKWKLREEHGNIARYNEDNPTVKKVFEKRLLLYEPFKIFVKIMGLNEGRIKKAEVGDLIKAELDADWKESSKKQYIEKLINWGIFAEIIFTEKNWIKLHPKYLTNTLLVESVNADYEEVFDKYLYDEFSERDISKFLKQVLELENELTRSGDKKKGEIFEKIVYQHFRILGFSVRMKAGEKERKVGLSYASREGGGDVGLFVHLPSQIQTKLYDGIAIACEAKATSNGAPKKSIDQVRTFSEQIKKLYPNYMVFKIVVSHSIGYEPVYAREKAFPDVVHIPLAVMGNLVNLQANKLRENKRLLTPFDIIRVISTSVAEGKLEITDEYVNNILQKTVTT